MKYTFEDFLHNASAELPPDAPLQDQVAMLEKEVADLKVQVGDLKADVKSLGASFCVWFQKHLSRLVGEALKEFSERTAKSTFLTALEKAEMHKQIQQAVEEMFQREANELFKAIVRALKR